MTESPKNWFDDIFQLLFTLASNRWWCQFIHQNIIIWPYIQLHLVLLQDFTFTSSYIRTSSTILKILKSNYTESFWKVYIISPQPFQPLEWSISIPLKIPLLLIIVDILGNLTNHIIPSSTLGVGLHVLLKNPFLSFREWHTRSSLLYHSNVTICFHLVPLLEDSASTSKCIQPISLLPSKLDL